MTARPTNCPDRPRRRRYRAQQWRSRTGAGRWQEYRRRGRRGPIHRIRRCGCRRLAGALGGSKLRSLGGEAVASFGSYDDRPGSRRLSALYANLRHHWVHQHGKAMHSPSGAASVPSRSEGFRAHRGFDPNFDKPSIEDVELGIRIIESGGRIRLVKDALGTHHKDWGVGQLWSTDILRRAMPWAWLMRAGARRANDSTSRRGERAAAIAAHLVLVTVLITFGDRTGGPHAARASPHIWPSICASSDSCLEPAGQARHCGDVLHWCYHLYASATYALVTSGLLLAPRRAAGS